MYTLYSDMNYDKNPGGNFKTKNEEQYTVYMYVLYSAFHLLAKKNILKLKIQKYIT